MKWIKCGEELPSIRLNVDYFYDNRSSWLLVYNGLDIFVACYRVDEEYGNQWVQFGRDAYTCNDVTHWMELPNFP